MTMHVAYGLIKPGIPLTVGTLRGDHVIRVAGRINVATVHGLDDLAKRDAAMLAAAPMMLEALRLALAEYEARTWTDPASPNSPASKIKSAIVAATGFGR